MSYPPLPSNGETQWGDKFRTWADALQGRKVEGQGLGLRYDTSVGTRVLLDRPGGGTTMVHGDTGFRNINELVPFGDTNQWVSSSIRRVNNTVFLQIFRDLTETIANSTQFNFIPYGFRLGHSQGRAVTHDNNYNAWRILAPGILQAWSTVSDTTTLLQIVYSTSDPWPTTLPGLPTT